jgi:hypothetical protein
MAARQQPSIQFLLSSSFFVPLIIQIWANKKKKKLHNSTSASNVTCKDQEKSIPGAGARAPEGLMATAARTKNNKSY